jgi:2-isopropylmalate synthase
MVTNKLALVAFLVVGSTDRRSRATVRISRGGHDHAEAEAEGNGPMDALFRATDVALDIRGEITGLRIYAFDTYGMVGKARITVNFEGRKYGGRCSSPDAVEAAAHAYLSAEVPRTSAE